MIFSLLVVLGKVCKLIGIVKRNRFDDQTLNPLSMTAKPMVLLEEDITTVTVGQSKEVELNK